MSTTQLARHKFILVKMESTYGVDSNPSATANAVEAFDFNLGAIESDKAKRQAQRGWLGNRSEILGGFRTTLEVKVEMAGSGSAGSVPQYGPLLRCCGHSEARMTTALSGTAQAESASGRVVLQSGSSVDDFYLGCPIILTGPSGQQHIAQISRYIGSVKMAYLSENAPFNPIGQAYTIPQNVNYNPVDKNYESATIYFQMDGVLKKMTGVRGTMSFSMQNKGIPTMTFKLTGIYQEAVDSVRPTPEYAYLAMPLMVCSANTKVASVHNMRCSMLDLSFEQGNQVSFRAPAGGTDQVIITDRAVSGSIKIESGSVADKNWEYAVRNRSLDGFYVLHGTEVGNRIGIGSEVMQVTDTKDGDDDGIITTELKITMTPNGPGRDYSLSFF